MLQSKARLLKLNAKLVETLTNKGVTATADETTTSLINKVSDISSGGDDSILASLIDRSIKSVVIPDGVTSIGKNAFCFCSSLTSIIIPNGVTKIGDSAFYNCTSLTSIIIPDSVTSIEKNAFGVCIKLKSIIIPNGVTSIEANLFQDCRNLVSVTIPNSITTIRSGVFYNCANLEKVTLGDGFNANNLVLSASTKYIRETILQWLNALADRTGQTAYKLTIGATNLQKLTEEDIAIATAKNWTLA